MYRPLWIEIDLKNLKQNMKKIRRHVGAPTAVMATIKQNAYGHGLVPVAQTLASSGVEMFGVGSLEEAAVLRNNGVQTDLLILTSLLPGTAEQVIDFDVHPAVSELSFVKALDKVAAKRKKKVAVHIKVDTGMGRVGVWHEDAEKFVFAVSRFKNIRLEGIFTHFPVADTDPAFTRGQIRLFKALVDRLAARGIVFRYIHCANSVALSRYKEAHFNLVRPGLILYGIKPDNSVCLDLRPVLSLRSKVVFLKKVGRRRSIGYGRTHITKKATSIATVAVGYADGYPWHLSNNARVSIKGKYYKVRGRVCMDHIMVDTGPDSPVRPGDTVTLIGRDKKAVLRAEDLSNWANTIPYEIVSRLSLSLPRIYK